MSERQARWLIVAWANAVISAIEVGYGLSNDDSALAFAIATFTALQAILAGMQAARSDRP